MPRPALGLALALLVFAAARAGGEELPQADASVASTDDAGGFLVNPAAGGLRYPSELQLGYADLEGRGSRVRALGSAGGLGLAWQKAPRGARSFLAGLSTGDERLRLGASALWARDDATGSAPGDARLGALSRPVPWASLGVTVDHLFRPSLAGGRPDREWVAGLGLRPLAFGRASAFRRGPRLTLTADVRLREGARRDEARVRGGAEVELIEGVALRGGVESGGAAQLGLTLRGVTAAYHGRRAWDRDGGGLFSEHAVSLHEGEDRTALVSSRDRRVAEIAIGGALADESLGGLSLLGDGGTTPVGPIHRALERALEDPLTRGVLLELRGVSSMAQVEELRPRLTRLRAAGKPVVAWLPYGGGRGDLYLASACDRIVTPEDADFGALGLRAERRYWRRLLAEWGVRVDRASYGRYKSAYREFSVDSTPPADREAIEHNLDVSQGLFVSTILAERRMTRPRLLEILDGRVWPAGVVREAGLIDSLTDRDGARALLGALAGLGRDPRGADPRDLVDARRAWTVPTRIAVVYASGAIETGTSGNDLLLGSTLGSETLIAQLEHAFESDDVRAVVLRIESPGGSSLASALMDRAVERLKREHRKPLIVSMGGSAASGGYQLAAHGDRLYADRFTYTGSIGVLIVKPSIERFLREHHVRQDAFERGRFMRGWSSGRDWDAPIQASADSAIDETYRRFVARVAHGRGMTWEQVDAVAQGRVWRGDDARARGLVDAIGGLEDAIAEARRRAGIPAGEEIRLAEYRRPRPGLVERLIGSWVGAAVERSARLPEPGAWSIADVEDEP